MNKILLTGTTVFHFTVNILCAERSDDDDWWPLQSKSKSIIMKNYSKLADRLDSDDDLICEMLSRECFTVYQLINIANTSDLCERNKKLLDLVLNGSIAAFIRFTECLQTTQPHLMPLLTGNTGMYNSFRAFGKTLKFTLRLIVCHNIMAND
jgi:hypothetical protein